MIYWTFSDPDREIKITCGDDFGNFIRRMQLSPDEWAEFYETVREIDAEVGKRDRVADTNGQPLGNTEFTYGLDQGI